MTPRDIQLETRQVSEAQPYLPISRALLLEAVEASACGLGWRGCWAHGFRLVIFSKLSQAFHEYLYTNQDSASNASIVSRTH